MAHDELRNDVERAEYLKSVLVARATSAGGNARDYSDFRKYFLQHPTASDYLPGFVRTNRDLEQFWQFIKSKFQHYSERRDFIGREFVQLLDFLEQPKRLPAARLTAEVLRRFDSESVQTAWARALERSTNDPEGAITAARTLLETVCKHILDANCTKYDRNSDLLELYGSVAKSLRLSPVQHTEKVFRQILQGCFSVVIGLGDLRNRLGDAHGQGKGSVRPKSRHSQLAVTLAGAVAVFLIETWEGSKADPNSSIPK
jgi:hypothetical protein